MNEHEWLADMWRRRVENGRVKFDVHSDQTVLVEISLADIACIGTSYGVIAQTGYEMEAGLFIAQWIEKGLTIKLAGCGNATVSMCSWCAYDICANIGYLVEIEKIRHAKEFSRTEIKIQRAIQKQLGLDPAELSNAGRSYIRNG